MSPSHGLELEKNEKSKIKGGGVICAPSAVYGRVTIIHIKQAQFCPQKLSYGKSMLLQKAKRSVVSE